jgi:predicted nucleic acid-binding protein
MEVSEQLVIFDSSVWVALLHYTDSQHQKALKVFGEVGDVIVVPEYVVIEVATVLKQQGKLEEARQFVHRVLNEKPESFLPAEALIRETASLFQDRSDKLSFTDTALLVLARLYRVVTFDRALQRAIAAIQ